MRRDNTWKAALNSAFDQIYVLTLEQAVERQENIRKLFSGINYRFFYGTDKHDLDFETCKTDGTYDSDFHLRTKRTSRDLSIGEIACAISHRRICEDTVANGYNRVLILEDDVLPIPEQLSKLEEVLAAAPADWQTIMLGYYDEKKGGLFNKVQQQIYLVYHHLGLFKWNNVSPAWIKGMCLREENETYFKMSKAVGAHAYALTLEGAKILADFQKPVRLHADRVFYYLEVDGDLKGYLPKRKLFTLSELSKESYIGYDSRSVKDVVRRGRVPS